MPPDENELNARIEALEARIAHFDQAQQELSDELYRQQRQIAKLEAHLGRMAERLESIESAAPGADPRDEIPPHY